MSSPSRAFLRGAQLQGILVLVVAGLVMLAVGVHAALGDDATGPHGTRIYVDARHAVRHPPDGRNLRHHHGYHTVSGTDRWIRELRRSGAVVHVEHGHAISEATLAGFDVVLLGEPSDEAAGMHPAEREALLRWVDRGGGLLAFAPPAADATSRSEFDRLFSSLGVRARAEDARSETSSGDDSAIPHFVRRESSPVTPAHPVMLGVDEHLVRDGYGLDTPHAIATSTPVEDDAAPHATVAALEHGRGRIVVFADVDAFTNPMIYYGDHLQLSRNALAWMAPPAHDPDVWWLVPGIILLVAIVVLAREAPNMRRGAMVAAAGGAIVSAACLWLYGPDLRDADVSDVLFHVGNGARVDLASDAEAGYFAAYTQWGKDPRIRPWASGKPIRGGYDALVLGAPTEPYSVDDLAAIDAYLARGRTVIYLATGASLKSPAGKQLQEHFDAELTLGEPVRIGRTPYRTLGPPDLLDGIFRLYVYPRAVPVRASSGLSALVHLLPGGRHVDDRMWTRRNCVYDVVSEARVGVLGKLLVIAPVELFDNRSLGSPYRVGDEIVQQTTDLLIRLLQRSVGRTAWVGLAAG